MKCLSCGAEVKEGNFCEYCGSELPKDTPIIHITNNYYGTPPTATQEVENKQQQTYTYTEEPYSNNTNTTVKKKKGFWWWCLMFFFFPFVLPYWFYKTDKIKLDKKWRIVIIVVFYLLVLTSGEPTDETQTPDTSIESTVDSLTTDYKLS